MAASHIVVTIGRMFEPHASKITAAFVFGSVARGKDTARSDIDLMIIGALDYDAVYALTDEVGQQLGRQVSPVLISPEDWRREIAVRDPFVSHVRASPKFFVFDTGQNI